MVPYASYVGSLLQKMVPRTRVEGITDGNAMLKELKDLLSLIKYRSLRAQVTSASKYIFSDASFSITRKREYGGQTGIILGLLIRGRAGT